MTRIIPTIFSVLLFPFFSQSALAAAFILMKQDTDVQASQADWKPFVESMTVFHNCSSITKYFSLHHYS
jgi:hypothetical protein